jgi:hypothetical protein
MVSARDSSALTPQRKSTGTICTSRSAMALFRAGRTWPRESNSVRQRPVQAKRLLRSPGRGCWPRHLADKDVSFGVSVHKGGADEEADGHHLNDQSAHIAVSQQQPCRAKRGHLTSPRRRSLGVTPVGKGTKMRPW